MATPDQDAPANTAKIIWIAGMGRSGSMWTYNVTRALLQAELYTVLPVRIPHTDEARNLEVRTAISDKDPVKRWVLKSHRRIDPATPHSIFITTRRDLRDVLISQMRFTAIDFDQALNAIQYFARVDDHYASFSDKMRLSLSYKEIVDEPSSVGMRIARFLGLSLDQAIVNSIIAKFSKERVARIVDQLAIQNALSEQGDGEHSAVPRVDRNDRLVDTRTGFQSGHISDYQDGSWRALLSADQQARLHERIGDWLHRNGYD